MSNPITFERKNDKQIERQCGYCGTTLFVTMYRNNKNSFCGMDCKGQWLRGENNPLYKDGNGYVRKDGRKKVYMPEHPYAPSDGKLYEYRLIAEEVIGRYLLPHECVHHKDLDPTNNDPSNLQVMTRSEHQKLHMELRRKKTTAAVIHLEASVTMTVKAQVVAA